jgi:hypothetical protein
MASRPPRDFTTSKQMSPSEARIQASSPIGKGAICHADPGVISKPSSTAAAGARVGRRL